MCGADVVEISSSDDDSDNAIQLLDSDEDRVDEASDNEADMSGNHVNDALNQHDASGRVLVNSRHAPDEPDIFLPPQIAAAIKPHQVCWLALLTPQQPLMLLHAVQFNSNVTMTTANDSE